MDFLSYLLAFVALFGTFGIFVLLFKGMRLTNPTEALGLPSGTVRSLIAFTVFVSFIWVATCYISVASTESELQTRSGLDQKALDDFKKSNKFATDITYTTTASATGPMYDVKYLVKNTKSDDVAKQVITLLGGLLATVVGFYFAVQATAGATLAAVNAAQNLGGGGEPPRLKSLVPPDSVPGGSIKDKSLKFTGENLNSVKRVVLSAKGNPDVDAINILSNDTELTCYVDKKDPLQSAVYDVTVYDGQSRKNTLLSGLTVT